MSPFNEERVFIEREDKAVGHMPISPAGDARPGVVAGREQDRGLLGRNACGTLPIGT